LRFNSVFENIPFGTVIVNLIGAFIIGLAVSFFSNSSISPNYKLFVVTGFCGALTTFSTFSVEIVALLQASKFEYAISTIAIHVIGSLIFTVLGILSYQFFTNH
ncbi:fluoride efflux transporter CrcB, partial [Klebsiella pneumoniae]